jgi:protein ImuB
MTSPTELYACLYARQFPAQALLRLRPELREKPCVVMAGEPPLEQVFSLNRKARTLGIVRGMTRVEIDTFSAVTVLPRSRKAETATKAILLECVGAFSSRVEDRCEEGVFLCAIDIAGTGSMFGPPEALAAKLLSHVRSLGMAGCIAVSHNFHAAVVLAEGMSPRVPVKIIRSGEESAMLAPLPLAVLELTERQAESFESWGIRTLGALAALPEKELIARMGQSGKRLLQLARGEMPHLFQPTEPAFNLEEHVELDSPVELLDALLFVLNVMLEQLILRASARTLALASVTIYLSLEGGATHQRTVRPALPANDKSLWIKLLYLDLEAHPPQGAILALLLTAEPGSTSKQQLGLFSPQLPEPGRLDVTLARIRAIVGDENVGSPLLIDTHQPGAFRMEPFRVPSSSASAVAHSLARSSVRRLRPAEVISVTTQNQLPKAFVFHRKHYAAEHTYGPWLINGDWWLSTQWHIEQWDVIARAQDSTMLCCCLVRDLTENCWQMAALYD